MDSSHGDTHLCQPRAETNAAPQTSPLALSLALFLFLFSVYLLTYSPRFHSSDGLAMFATTESLVRRGEWDADQIRWMGLQQGILGLDGHLYIRKGVGVSLLALPLVWLGLIIPAWGPATTVLVFNALVTAATGAILVRYLQALDYDDRVALVAALTFGLATLAWPYAKTFFSDPLAALCLLAAALALMRFRHTAGIINAFWAGLALAIAVAARYANAVMIPFYGLLLLYYQTLARRGVGGSSNPNRGSNNRTLRTLATSLGAWVGFGAPLLAMAMSIAYYNLARYGDPFNTGYLAEESFSGIWWQGVAGMLVSPGRGLLLYAPVLLMAFLAAPTFYRRHRAEAALAWAVILVHLLLYGKWFMWHGGFAWGPRFMVPTLPFFVIGLVPAIRWGTESKWWRACFLALAVLSTLIQVLGLSVHFELFQYRLLDTGLPLFAPITFFASRYSPLVGQFQFLRPENLDFAWITGGRMDGLLLAPLVIAVVLSGWGLIKMAGPRSQKTGKPEDWIGRQSGSARFYNLPILHPVILPCLAVLFAAAWLLVRAHTLYPRDLRDAAAVLNARATAADAIITATPEESAAFADLYKGHADVLGLNAGSPFNGDTTAALAEMTSNHPYVWYLPNWLPPEQSNVETWLMRQGFRIEDTSVGSRRLALYHFPPQPLTETPIGVALGSNIILERIDTLPTAYAGDVLPLTLHWMARQPVLADYHVYIHLLDAEGSPVTQSDGHPAVWTRPTSSWSPGEHIQDRHALVLPADLSPGDYALIAGLYLPESGERLLTDSGEAFVALGDLHITTDTP
ncbi:MAG: hypothetical protein JSV81_15325 [Anaerolineales bacterium]|nr:MAG: hypothetical protein JSV81_15325 [Anaerolineales bacterium]